MRPIIPVFFTIDDGYAPLLGVALQSMIENASTEYQYHIHILISSQSQAFELQKYVQQHFLVFLFLHSKPSNRF